MHALQDEQEHAPNNIGRPDRVFTVLRSEPELNPYGSDLEKDPGAGRVISLAYGVPAGQLMIMTCPRGDLNTNPREISPDRGFHADEPSGLSPRVK